MSERETGTNELVTVESPVEFAQGLIEGSQVGQGTLVLEKEIELVLDRACSDWFIEDAVLAFQYFGGLVQPFRQVNQVPGFLGKSVCIGVFLAAFLELCLQLRFFLSDFLEGFSHLTKFREACVGVSYQCLCLVFGPAEAWPDDGGKEICPPQCGNQIGQIIRTQVLMVFVILLELALDFIEFHSFFKRCILFCQLGCDGFEVGIGLFSSKRFEYLESVVNEGIEFIQFKRWLERLYSTGTSSNGDKGEGSADSEVLLLDYKSCEMISDELFDKIAERYPGRSVWIEVSEDGENGSFIPYNI